NNTSNLPSISADGRYIAFFSIASNLVSDDGNSTGDVFLATNNLVPSNQAPTANPGGPYFVAEGSSIILDGTSSSDPDLGFGAHIVAYDWDLDNNGSFETAGATPPFSAAGRDGPNSQTVRLRVTDSFGASGIVSTTVSITNALPTATLSNNG